MQFGTEEDMTEVEITKLADEAIAEEFELDIEKLVPTARFKDDLGLDSLDAVDMVVVLEKTFSIKIGKDPAILAILTVGDMHSYIIQKKAALESEK